MAAKLAGNSGRGCLVFCLSCMVLWLGSGNARAQEITVAAAISLKDAFVEIGKLYQEKETGTRVLFSFGGSGDLARQIEAGAPLDVFASAAQKDMDNLERKGLLVAGTRTDFAGNAVVLVRPARAGIPMKSLRDLAGGAIKRIVIGNPKTVPAGRYAEEALRWAQVWSMIQDKLVFAENVRQALDYVARNEVDAGLVYATDARIRSREAAIVMTVPGGSHQPVVYPLAAIKGAKGEAGAQFIHYVLAKQGQAILRKYGFHPVGQAKQGNGFRRQ